MYIENRWIFVFKFKLGQMVKYVSFKIRKSPVLTSPIAMRFLFHFIQKLLDLFTSISHAHYWQQLTFETLMKFVKIFIFLQICLQFLDTQAKNIPLKLVEELVVQFGHRHIFATFFIAEIFQGRS